jgi:hypothetical protein
LAANKVASAGHCLVNGKLAVHHGEIYCKFSVSGRAGVNVKPDPGYKAVGKFGVGVAGFCMFEGGLDEG